MWQNFYPTMMNWGQQGYSMMGWSRGYADTSLSFGFLLLIIWTLTWKGMALWKAAREENKYWFVGLLVVNTFGILEILYLYVFTKKDASVKEHHKA